MWYALGRHLHGAGLPADAEAGAGLGVVGGLWVFYGIGVGDRVRYDPIAKPQDGRQGLA